MSNERERRYALMEANQVEDEDLYFSVRPHLDSKEARRLFDAGYARGWDARRALDEPNPTTSKPNAMCRGDVSPSNTTRRTQDEQSSSPRRA